MGLAERRAVEEFKTKHLPALQKEINAAAFFEVTLDVKWDTVTLSPGYSLVDYPEWVTKIYFTPLVQSFKNITIDDMGKQALKEGLKKVVIDGSEGYSYGSFTFEGGELLLKHKPDTNIDNVEERTEGLTKLLESKL